MRTFLALIFILCFISILVVLGLIIYESLKKQYKYKLKNLSKTIAGLIMACFVLGLIDYSLEYRENKLKEIQTLSQKKLSNTTKENNSKKIAEEERIKKVRSDQPIYAKLLESGKTYEQMNEEERKNAYYIVTVWDDFEQSFKEKYQSEKDNLEKDRTAFFKAEEAKIIAKQAEEKKASYDTGITYEQLARTPDDYKDKKAKFSGKVIQVVEGEKENDLRIAVDGNYDTILYVGYNGEISSTRILENDYVTVRGTSLGIYSYQSTMGGKISVPSMWVDQIDLSK